MSGAKVTEAHTVKARQFLRDRGHWQDPVYVTYDQLVPWIAQALAEAEAGEREAIAQEGDARISELEAADLPCLAFKVFVEIIRARGEATS